MARGHAGLPPTTHVQLSKTAILKDLASIDRSTQSTNRVLNTLETEFRLRVSNFGRGAISANSAFQAFGTSPFVLMIHANLNKYSRISEIEHDILPAKQFSSMETSAGRMIEDVTLPAYGWTQVTSGMHTANSSLDGKRRVGSVLQVSTLKSGPRCLNDEMSENFADAIISHGSTWVKADHATSLEWTYGVLYGTKRQSNKKDWHILRNLGDKLKASTFTKSPMRSWDCAFSLSGIPTTATVRVGKEWWDYLGGPLCLTEVCTALIRACVTPGQADPLGYAYSISDLGDIVSVPSALRSFNPSILQNSQIPWLFFLMRHFCDNLVP